MLCWRSELGEFLQTQAPLLLESLRQDISLPVTSLVQHLAPPHPTLGGAYSIALWLLERELDGEWAMENKFTYGMTNGFLPYPHTKSSPLPLAFQSIQWFPLSLIRPQNGEKLK